MSTLNAYRRLAVFLVLTAIIVVAGWFLFLEYPESTRELLGIVLLLLLLPVGLRIGGSIARSVVPPYNVAEVGVTGPITREKDPSLLSPPVGTSANAIVEQIERADADSSVEALLVRLNTPGGEIVPSEDIKLAIEKFDGPTLAYATDTCASGGYEIASGCDEIWARDGSLVGSIGVIGSRVTAAELADKLGLEYEQLTAGEYKDAGVPLRDLEEHEREYLQGIIDDYYDQFVENVAARRELDSAEIRDTEARIFLGSEAAEIGLVDELGARDDVEDRLEDLLQTDVSITQFEPQFGPIQRLGVGAQRVAFAFGAGMMSTLRGENEFSFEKRR